MNRLVVIEARRWLGTPYRHQAAAHGAGCDCLGLIRGIWRTLHGREAAVVPPYSSDWRQDGFEGALEAAARKYLEPVQGTPQPGDVLLFRLMRHRAPRHCGVLVSDGHFIHAQEQLGVVEAALTEAWQRRIAGTYRFPAHLPAQN